MPTSSGPVSTRTRAPMRFAYIDSQGNEVEIPSEDALRLRIELGAIVEGTSLYDGSKDQWGPAADHDLFRRLRRDLNGEGPSEASALPRTDSTFDRSALEPAWSAPEPARPESGLDPSPAAGPPFDGAWANPTEAVDASSPASPPPAVSSDAPGGATEPALPEEGFDFSDFGTIELEDDTPVAPRSTAPPPENPERGWEPPVEAAAEADDPWTMPGREPWPPPAETFAPQPVRDRVEGHPFDADEETPEWLRNDPDFDDSADAGSRPGHAPAPAAIDGGGVGVATAPAPPAKIKRAAPKRPPIRNSGRRRTGLAALAVAVLVVAAGGFWVLGRGGLAAEPEIVEVVLPSIAPSLEPVFRSASSRAVAQLVGALQTLPMREALPERPDPAWLGGRYMATAGEYTDVRLFWEQMRQFAQVAQAREAEFFDAELTAALDSVALPPADREAVEARSRAGFAASAPDREAVYRQLRAVVESSLTLHTFLEQNQGDIDFAPADAGLSADPVLEAVPLTDELGDEMWNRVADITSALDALGFLDQVTTDGLLGVFFEKLEAVPIR